MFTVGPQLNRLFSKADMKRGGIPSPGNVASSINGADGGMTEYLSVKLAGSQTLLNGMAVTIDTASGVAVVGTTNVALAIAGRIGILVLGSATATITAVGTSYCWAQIYGRANALTSASITAPGQQLMFGVDGRLIAAVAGSASGAPSGIISIGTATAAVGVLLPVMLSYPEWQGVPT